MPSRRIARRRPRSLDRDTSLAGLPVVAIVGRPNVGKSTLFNRLVGERRAIVEDRARTTRDRLYGVAEWNDRRYVVIDTGGMEVNPGDAIEERVQDQARLAIEEADVIVFVVDAAAGLTPADQEVAETLRLATSPIVMAVNKADNEKLELQGAEFLRLGWLDSHAVSALHGRGSGDLLDAVVAALPAESADELERKAREARADEIAELVEEGLVPGFPHGDAEGFDGFDGLVPDGDAEADDGRALAFEAEPPPTPRIAIVGRPNVGKSSLLNQLLGEERAIVSDIPGTTRDAIDTTLEWQGREVRLVDTAGLRRRGKVASGPAAERYSALRALKAIGRADVCVLVLDAQDGLTAQDAHVAGYVVDEGVGLVLAINKWDLVEKDDKTFEEYVNRIRGQAPFLHFAPVVAISALTGLRAGRVLDDALEIAAERRRRVPTRAAQQGARGRGLATPAAAREGPPPALLLRHAGGHRAAHLRALRERRAISALQLPALPGEPHPGRLQVRGHAPAPHLPRALPCRAGAARQGSPLVLEGPLPGRFRRGRWSPARRAKGRPADLRAAGAPRPDGRRSRVARAPDGGPPPPDGQ